MNPAIAVDSTQRSAPWLGLVWGGLIAGTMDITAALVVYGHYGLPPIRLLQSVAAGLLGARAYEGGLATALLGLLCHFVIAFGAATVFFLASRSLSFLVQHAVLSGVLYGVAVFFFFNRLVVALSPARKNSFFFKKMGHS